MSTPARVWMRHPDTKAVKEVAASAVPVMARGSWAQLSADELKQLHAEQAADRAARLAALAPASAPTAPAAPEPAKASKKAAPEKATAPAATPEKQES